MNGIGPLLDDAVSVDFETDSGFAFGLPDTHSGSLFSLAYQPRERIDSEEFDEASFGRGLWKQPEGEAQTSPFDTPAVPKPPKQRKKRSVVSRSVAVLPSKLQFPTIGRHKKLAKVRPPRSPRRPRRSCRLNPTGLHPLSRRSSACKSSPGKAPRTMATTVKETPKSRRAATVDSQGSCSGENRSTKDSLPSLTPQTRHTSDHRPLTPRALDKMHSKISKLRTFWTLRNRIQPQIFRFLVYDLDTRKLSFEFVDHSLKGILNETPADAEREASEGRPDGKRRGLQRAFGETGGVPQFFPFDD